MGLIVSWDQYLNLQTSSIVYWGVVGHKVATISRLIYMNDIVLRFSHCRYRQSVKKEINLAVIIICIVVVFICCNITRVILNCYEVFMTQDIINCGPTFTPPVWFLCLTSFNHFSLVLNASVNFIVYLVLGRKFRRLATKTFKMFFRYVRKLCRVE